MDKHGLTTFEFERDGEKVSLKRGGDNLPPAEIAAAAALPALPAAATMPDAIAPPEEPEGEKIESPMVGTFYRSPSPEQPFFVKVGDTVNEDSVVCIVEAMKVMNEVKAETTGVISKVLVEDSTPVQYGEPLFEIKSA